MELLKSLKIPKRLNFQRIRVTWVIFLKAYELWVKFRGARELWVKFQNFSSGAEEKRERNTLVGPTRKNKICLRNYITILYSERDSFYD